MALILCRECGKEISDQATACPQCGCPANTNNQNDQVNDDVPNSDSNSIQVESEDFNANDDLQEAQVYSLDFEQPSEAVAEIPNKRINKKTLIIVASIVGLIVIAFASFMIYQNNQANQARLEYIENLNAIKDTALTGAAEAEDVCNLTYKVWYNTIFEKYDSETDDYTINTFGGFNSDFNNSITILYASLDSEIASIKDNRAEMDELMKSLQNPPEEFTEAYDVVNSMYSEYYSLTGLAITPSGSLQTYHENLSSYDNEFIKYYDKLVLLIPEE